MDRQLLEDAGVGGFSLDLHLGQHLTVMQRRLKYPNVNADLATLLAQ